MNTFPRRYIADTGAVYNSEGATTIQDVSIDPPVNKGDVATLTVSLRTTQGVHKEESRTTAAIDRELALLLARTLLDLAVPPVGRTA